MELAVIICVDVQDSMQRARRCEQSAEEDELTVWPDEGGAGVTGAIVGFASEGDFAIAIEITQMDGSFGD